MKTFSFVALLTLLCSLFTIAWGSAALGNLQGKAVDKTTSGPIAGVFVTATGMGITRTAVTDHSGHFAFVDLEPGEYELALGLVGYRTLKVTNIPVTANSTLSKTFPMEEILYKVSGVKVSGYKGNPANPRQTMTYYDLTKEEIEKFLPGPAGLSINGLLEELPGVQTYTPLPGFPLGGPHVRGGTGFGLVYAVDGIPLNNTSLSNDLGNTGIAVGVSDFQFWPGIYPVQYGNGIDGYQNTIVPEGTGELRGDLQFSYGFWLDQGENAPIFKVSNGQFVGESSLRPANPDIWNLELSGQSGKFHYYLNYVARDGGGSGFNNPPVFAPLAYSGEGGEVWRDVTRDAVLNLNYDLDPQDELQALFLDGFGEKAFEFQCFSTNACGFPIPSGDASFSPVPTYAYKHYDLESLGYTRHFSQDKAMTFRVWQYNNEPDQFAPSAADGFFEEDNVARTTGARVEFNLNLAPENTLTLGGEYLYTGFDARLFTVLNPTTASYAAVIGEGLQGVANTQNPSLWLNEEWAPTSRLEINAGIRWDQMIYQPLTGPGILTQANGLPFASETFTGFAPDATMNNPSDPYGLFSGSGADCTPLLHVCANQNTLSPSFIQPRVSASYRLTDDFTLKAGWGEFATFSPSANVDFLSQLCAPGTGTASGFILPCAPAVINGTPYSSVALATTGNIAQTGSDTDLSFEYMFDDAGFVKVTPYYKNVQNPLVFTFIPIVQYGGFVNASHLESRGVELTLQTRDWHGLTGMLDYTYNRSRITGDPEFTLLLNPSQFFISNFFSGSFIFNFPNAQSNAATLFAQAMATPTPVDWDIPHTLRLLLDYRAGERWEIAPNFSFASGEPYGLGALNLQSLFTNLKAACAAGPNPFDPYLTPANCALDIPTTFTTNGETTPNSFLSPSVFTGNLAVTYHASRNFSATLQIFNLWNANTVLVRNSSSVFAEWMALLGYPNRPDFSALKGNYAPGAVEPIRQYFITATLDF